MRLLDYIRTNNKKLGKGLLPRKLFALCVLLLLPFANTLSATHFELYGTVGAGGSFTESTLITIDQNTGALKDTIGPVGYLINGLAFDPTTGNLYASTANNDPNFRGLISIDTLTGIGTPIGSGWGLPLGDAIVCITCNAAGQLYGWIEPSPSSQDDLVIIDKTAGTFSQFPNAGLSTWTLGLDFDSSGTLWLFNGTQSMYTINLTTGAPTLMGTFTPQFVHHGKFNPDTWNYWGIDESYGINPRNIAIIDVPSGAQLGSLPTVNDLHTLAFVSNKSKALLLLQALGKKRLIYQKGLYP